MLDHLLPASYTQGNSASQVAKLAKTFLQCLASTNLPTDALTVFVNEFRAAFSRSLALPESQFKHYRVRALAGLLGQIVEPTTTVSSRSIVNPSQFVRMLIRKGFITDLAKAVYNLDLSSPMLATTVNTLLKPLESLTKIVTQFVAAQKRASSMTGNKREESSQATATEQQTASGGATAGGEQAGASGSIRPPQQPTEEGSAPRRTVELDTQPANTSSAGEGLQESVLGSADESLIPLQEDEEQHEDVTGPPPSNELLQEAMNVAFQLGRRRFRRGVEVRSGEHPDEDMDIDVSKIHVHMTTTE